MSPLPACGERVREGGVKQHAGFNQDNPLDICASQNQLLVGRVSPQGFSCPLGITRHVGLKPDLRPNGLSGFKLFLPSPALRERG